jgi:hypothetical protein
MESTVGLSKEPIKPNRKRANLLRAEEDRDAKAARLGKSKKWAEDDAEG